MYKCHIARIVGPSLSGAGLPNSPLIIRMLLLAAKVIKCNFYNGVSLCNTNVNANTNPNANHNPINEYNIHNK